MQLNRDLKRFSLAALFCFPFFLILTLSFDGRGEGEGENLASGFTYQLASPGRKLSFPADHASHPDYKIDWWYYTGHLEAESGKRYGYQVTFFRFGLRDRQKEESNEHPTLFSALYMAHFGLSDLNQQECFFWDRVSRGYGH